jgi:hypothetical protein
LPRRLHPAFSQSSSRLAKTDRKVIGTPLNYINILDNSYTVLVEWLRDKRTGLVMERIKPLAITSPVIISLALLLFLSVPADIDAQIAAPQFSELTTAVTGIVQDTQTAVTKWNNGYFAGSLKELEPQFNPGIAAEGPYSSLISGASLKSKEMPYYGPISGGFYW